MSIPSLGPLPKEKKRIARVDDPEPAELNGCGFGRQGWGQRAKRVGPDGERIATFS